jgi:hypothetical protein
VTTEKSDQSGEREADTAVEAVQSTGATMNGRKRVNGKGEKSERRRNKEMVEMALGMNL